MITKPGRGTPPNSLLARFQKAAATLRDYVSQGPLHRKGTPTSGNGLKSGHQRVWQFLRRKPGRGGGCDWAQVLERRREGGVRDRARGWVGAGVMDVRLRPAVRGVCV